MVSEKATRRQLLYWTIDRAGIHCLEYPNRTPVLVDLLMGIISDWKDHAVEEWMKQSASEWNPELSELWKVHTRPDPNYGLKISGRDTDNLDWFAQFAILLSLLHRFGDFACVGWR